MFGFVDQQESPTKQSIPKLRTRELPEYFPEVKKRQPKSDVSLADELSNLEQIYNETQKEI